MQGNRNHGLSRLAFEELCQKAYPMIYNRVSSRFADPQLAEEVSVDSLTQAFEKWRTDPAWFCQHDLTAWSSRWATWRALDRLRERTRFRPLPEERAQDERVAVVGVRPRRENVPEAQARDHQLAWDCLQRLDPEDRVILSR